MVLVAKLDRPVCSLKALLDVVEIIEEKGSCLQSLGEPVEISSEMGRFMEQIMGMPTEFERKRIRERTLEDLEAAHERGRIGGHPPRFTTEQRQMVA